MKCVSRSRWRGIIGGMLAVILLGASGSAGGPKTKKYRHSDVDMHVSLAAGMARTPEFPVVNEAYYIMIQVEKHLPIQDIRCMMGLEDGTDDFKDCKNEPILQIEWKVLDSEKIVAQGSSTGWGPARYTDENLAKFIGQFMGETGKKYEVEVKFTKDGTPLNVTNPHLIVIRVRYH